MYQRGRRHVLSHAAIYLVARGLPGLVAFIAIPLFTRLLEPAAYGRYALVIATVGMLNAMLFQWLRLSLVRYLPVYANDEAKLKGTLASAAAAIIGALGLVGAVLTVLPGTRDSRDVIVLCWVVLAMQAMFELCCEYSRALLKPMRYMALQLVRAGSTVGVGALLIHFGLNWWGPLIGLALGMSLGVAYTYRCDWRGIRFGIDRQVLASMARYGIPLSLTVALAVMIFASDRFLIAYFMGDDAAGLYAVASDFTSQTLTLLMMSINMAVFPMAVRAWESHGREAATEQMRHNASLLLAIGVPCVFGLSTLTPGIVVSFFGEDFRAAAATVIPLVAAGALLDGLKAYHFDAAFQFVHRTIHQVWIVLTVAAVNIVLNVIAIPRWGIAGSAAVTVAAYGLSIALTIAVGRRYFKVPFPVGACVRVLVASAVMAAALWPLRSYVSPFALAAQVAGGAALYGVVLIVTNFLGVRDAIVARLYVRAKLRADSVESPDDRTGKVSAARLAETN